MACIQYIQKSFHSMSMALIEKANEIIAEYDELGYDLTLRQLYYQFVARGLLPNESKEYDKLGRLINDARLAGLVDWDAIQDRTRNIRSVAHWDSPEQIVRSCAKQFHTDLWVTQSCRVEVWIEKDALIGVIEPTCDDLDVACFSCRGFVSQSEMWRAAQRFIDYNLDKQNVVILHLGDLDPSGVDMTRDIQARLDLFGANVMVDRIALNMDQVKQYNPPPNPVKFTDSRSASFVKQYGKESWELDALSPPVLTKLVTDEVLKLRDANLFQTQIREQETLRAQLQYVADDWDTIVRD